MEKRFLSVAEVMKFLGISRPTLYRLLAGGMPFYRLGGRRIFDREELVAWIKSGKSDKRKKPTRPRRKGGAKPSAKRRKK
jgi:excisionase family DNA binding protein